MPKRSAAGKADAEEKEELQSFPDELAINSDTSDDSEGQFNESDEEDEEDDVETGLAGLDALIATARAQRRAPAAGAESRGPHGAAGAATPPIERDAHVGPDIEGEHSMGEIIDDDAVKGGSSVDRERGPGPQQSTEDQSTRQGGRFPLSKRVPEDSLLRDEAFMADDGSDSSEDERPPKNTVGDVPLEWYQHEEHIGYDRDGKAIKRRGESGDMLDKLLLRNDAPGTALRTIYDPYNDEELVLSRQELRTLLNIQKGRTPEVSVDPYADHQDWYSNTIDPFPVSAATLPKRRFRPSVWEERKIVKLVRAIRRGWIKRPSEREEEQEKQSTEPLYLMWDNDGNVGSHKTGAGLTRIAAPKPELPGNEESYNPPPEYLPTDAEKAAYAAMEEEDRPSILPHAYGSLREVPAYPRFIHERFERCLDLYLCPRVRRKRMNVSKPDDLLPACIPKPSSLKPYPNRLCITYEGHRGKIRSICPDATGQWLLTGGDDGSMRLWEVLTGRCERVWEIGSKVTSVSWCPDASTRLVACTSGNHVILLDSGVGPSSAREKAAAALKPPPSEDEGVKVARWEAREEGGMQIVHNYQVRSVNWHGKGDYFVATCPGGASQSVVVHQLSKRNSQNPFRKNKGKVTNCAFHPTQPLLLVASETNVKVYNLMKQALTKTLLAGGGVITAMHIHPSGDHVLIGTEDKRCLWFDLDLSSKPYKVMKYHNAAVRAVCFHTRYPLFASSSDDGSVQVFHGMVYSDLMSNPLIVPVKTLSIHKVFDYAGVTSLAFHPSQPWVFSGGGDGKACLVVDV